MVKCVSLHCEKSVCVRAYSSDYVWAIVGVYNFMHAHVWAHLSPCAFVRMYLFIFLRQMLSPSQNPPHRNNEKST